MNWYSNLYIGKKAQENMDSIIEKIKCGKLQINKFVLALPINNVDVLDIYPSNVLVQKRYMESDMLIIGVADGKDEAKELMRSIIMECYNVTGEFDIRKYIESKE